MSSFIIGGDPARLGVLLLARTDVPTVSALPVEVLESVLRGHLLFVENVGNGGNGSSGAADSWLLILTERGPKFSFRNPAETFGSFMRIRALGVLEICGICSWDFLVTTGNGHAVETGLESPETPSLFWPCGWVASVGSSVRPIAGDGALVLVPDRSVMAESGECCIWLSGIAFASFLCRRVFGIEKEFEEKDLRLLRLRPICCSSVGVFDTSG